jgi:transcriptional regulator with XRE-family HTH domain
MFDTRKIASYICNLRKDKDITQVELANMLNVSHQAVSKWERAESMPDVGILPELADILDVTVDDILNGGRPTKNNNEGQIINEVAKGNTQRVSQMLDNNEIEMESVINVAPMLKTSTLDKITSGIEKAPIDIENIVIERMLENSRQTELWRIVRDNVTEEENTVISARYRNNLSHEVIGQYLGKSREMARQIEAKALRKLRRSRITRQLEERFEVNYARAYRGSLGSFNYTWNSIVENIAIRNLDALSNE